MIKQISLVILLLVGQVAHAVCETKREYYVENSVTRIWKTTICPKQKLPFHSHNVARVIIPEENGSLQVIYRSGKVETLKLEKNTPLFFSAAQGKEAHQDLNPGRKALTITVIEYSQAKKS